MDLKQMQYEARQWVDDMDMDTWDPVAVLMALNWAKNQVYDQLIEIESDRYLTSYNFSTVADQAEYALPTLFKKADRVTLSYPSWAADANPRIYKFVITDERDTNFNASVAWIIGSNFYLQPAPSEAGTLNAYLWYFKQLADAVLDATEWDIPPGMADLIVMMAARRLLAQKGRASAMIDRLYAEALQPAARGARRARTSSGLKYSPYSLRLSSVRLARR